MQAMQPALRDYLTKLREDAYIDIKPGYVDTGASPNETKPIYTTAEAKRQRQACQEEKEAGSVLEISALDGERRAESAPFACRPAIASQ